MAYNVQYESPPIVEDDAGDEDMQKHQRVREDATAQVLYALKTVMDVAHIEGGTIDGKTSRFSTWGEVENQTPSEESPAFGYCIADTDTPIGDELWGLLNARESYMERFKTLRKEYADVFKRRLGVYELDFKAKYNINHVALIQVWGEAMLDKSPFAFNIFPIVPGYDAEWDEKYIVRLSNGEDPSELQLDERAENAHILSRLCLAEGLCDVATQGRLYLEDEKQLQAFVHKATKVIRRLVFMSSLDELSDEDFMLKGAPFCLYSASYNKVRVPCKADFDVETGGVPYHIRIPQLIDVLKKNHLESLFEG